MYTKGDLVEDYTSGDVYLREIFGPDGDFVCHVLERAREEEGTTEADILLSHLNR